jgi:membrane fusion protein (multidrug efflux system)
MATTTIPETAARVAASPPPAGPASPRRRSPALPILALVVLAGGAYGVRAWRYASTHESTDNAVVDGHVIPVVAKVGGFVTRLGAGENVHVAEGALLVQLDDRDQQVKLRQAEADLAAAQAAAGGRGGAGQAGAAIASAESQQAASVANAAAARANADRARADLARYVELARTNVVSQQQVDAARAASVSADAQLAAVQRQTAAIGAQVGGAQAGLTFARARLVGAEAARDNARLQLAYATVTAPVAGTASKRLVEVGQLVQPGQQLLSVTADTGLFVSANFKETQLDRLRVGQPVTLTVDAYDDAGIEGVIESVSPATGARFALLPPDNASGNFTKVVQRVPVRIRIVRGLDAERPLRVGLSVVAHVDVSAAK